MRRYLLIILSVVAAGVATLLVLKPTPARHSEKEYPSDWFFQQRAFPYGQIPTKDYYQAIRQTKEMAASPLKSGQEAWEQVGPVNVGGRIQDIEMIPGSKEIIYVGAASGGIFKSTDTGRSFTQIFDDALTQSIGDIDLFKGNPNIIYVGTGEPNAGGGSINYDGNGVYKSLDAGLSWKPVGLEDVGSIGRVKVHPTNPDIVFVAAMGHLFATNHERGIFRTTNGGASWENVLFISDSTGGIDLCIHPTNPLIVYAAMWERNRRQDYRNYGGASGGIFRSNDGGNTWTRLNNGLLAGKLGRIGIDISESNPSILYAAMSDTIGLLKGIYKTTNGGDSWSRTGASMEPNNANQWWYCILNVAPTNPDIVYFSGLEVYKTTNGGTTWENTFRNAHVDMHGVFIHPEDPQFVLLGGDGGVDISYNGGNTYTHILSLPCTQFYTCEVDFLIPHRYYGGTQDNGTLRTLTGSANSWSSIYGGDGFWVKVDPKDNKYVYAESQFGGFGRSVNGGSNFTSAKSGISSSERNNWRAPFILDPVNPSVLYFGTSRVYKSTNRAVSWTAISPDLTNGTGPDGRIGTLYALSASEIDGKILYAGTDDGNVWNTLTGGSPWNKIDAGLPERWVTSVACDPFDAATAYVTFSGYRWDSYATHVFRTRNNGQSWEDIGNGLPDLPANDIVIDPLIPNVYYLATDGGVFVTKNGGTSWEVFGDGMPAVPVTDLTFHNPTRKLTAATYGRSMYTISMISGTGSDVVNNLKSKLITYPNPFSDIIHLKFTLEKSSHVEICVLSLSGSVISTVCDQYLASGDHDFSWNGQTRGGSHVSAGNYMIKMITAGRIWSQIVVKN
jgi:photosystem II stability/assembly factor-like uncharacterized protein